MVFVDETNTHATRARGTTIVEGMARKAPVAEEQMDEDVPPCVPCEGLHTMEQ